MPIDPAVALAAPAVEESLAWTVADVLLYHLSLGAGSRPDDPELDLTYEKDLTVLPTFALVAGTGPSAGERQPPAMSMPGIDIDLRKVLHAGQRVTVHRPLPASGEAVSRRRVSAVIDKQKAALIEVETAAEDTEGPLWTHVSQIWAHGEGGFAADTEVASTSEEARTSDAKGSADGSAAKEGADVPAADPEVLSAATRVDQAALYRLNGDYNPLHIDPDFARMAGLERPILHGLATLGIGALALTRRYGHGLTHIGASFSRPVLPGDDLEFDVSAEAEGRFSFGARSVTQDTTVLSRGEARFTHAG